MIDSDDYYSIEKKFTKLVSKGTKLQDYDYSTKSEKKLMYSSKSIVIEFKDSLNCLLVNKINQYFQKIDVPHDPK